MGLPGRRAGFFLISVACAGAMGFAFYAQYVMGLEPCPLCMLQRVGVVAAGVLALIAGLINPRRWGFRLWSLLVALAAMAGGAVSIRQLWLQSLPPDQVPQCGPGLDYLLQTLPFTHAMEKILMGSGECAVVDWRFLGMAMPFWVLTFFVLVILFVLFQQRPMRAR
ncbi:MAG: disulfide bond formation protein B [Paludibacterium sp.]|uniref:disulfide bond formation protein B n=1 Tax=Paludibacterium sp. TaxID=1917523 RepID=UPI0025E1273B|nr:disulfide bond formation protein B [Paludibacterium sp.]MBV8045632.1 disulfide bond formation protein B [Paludibacterium sp.]MBV8647538.1 disulfide bond formation protein B [Paludibacterium sp.]